MFKRIFGGVLAGIGVPVFAVATLTALFTIPLNFRVEGEGLLWIARLVETYRLTDEILWAFLGVSLVVSSVPLFLTPRRRTVKLSEVRAESVVSSTKSVSTSSAPRPGDQVELVLYTSLMDVARAGACSGHTAGALEKLRPGDQVCFNGNTSLVCGNEA